MDKYINMLLIQISQKYKASIVIIMSYNKKYKRVSKSYKLIIDKKTLKSKYPSERISLDISGKQNLILEMMKWI